MALRLDGTSQYLLNSTPLFTDYPWWFSCWFRLDSVNTVARCLVGIADSADTDVHMHGGINSNEIIRIVAQQNGGAQNVGNFTTPGSLEPGLWHFGIWRFINSTNRRASLINLEGDFGVGGASTASTSPATCDRLAIGCRAISTPDFFWHGDIAEVCIGTGDPYESNTIAPTHGTVLHLALNGIFSVPSFARRVLHYRSFRTDPLGGDINDVWDAREPLALTNVGGATIAEHVPLPGYYQGPVGPISPVRRFRRFDLDVAAAPGTYTSNLSLLGVGD